MKKLVLIVAAAYIAVIGLGMIIAQAQAGCNTQPDSSLDASLDAPGSLGGVMGTGVTKREILSARASSNGGISVVEAKYRSTAYAPAAGGINCGTDCESTASGIRVSNGTRQAYLIASNPKMNKYGALVYVWPNPYKWAGPFVVADTGGNFNGSDGTYRVDFYVWGDADKQFSNAWGNANMVSLSKTPLAQSAQALNASIDSSPGATRLRANTVDQSTTYRWGQPVRVSQAKLVAAAAPSAPAPSADPYSDVITTVEAIKGDPVGFALVDADGKVVAQSGATKANLGRSVTKAMILVALTLRASGRDLTANENALATSMIENSDNAAASALFAQVGLSGVNAVAAAAGMTHWSPDTSDSVYTLGESKVTAGDLARLFARIDQLMSARHRAFGVQLLSNIQGAGRFGVLNAGIAGAVLSKGGWMQEPGGWSVNQGAQFTAGGKKYGFAMVLGAQPSFAAGGAAIEEVARESVSAAGGSSGDASGQGCANSTSSDEGAPEGQGYAAVVAAAEWMDRRRYVYCYGGGHVTPAKPTGGQWCTDESGGQGPGDSAKGFDCSSSTSWILQHAGIKVDTLDSTGFMSWGEPGPGKQVTIYANPGHVFLKIGTRMFSTSVSNYRHGPGWVPTAMRSTAGFVERHPRGL